LLLFVGIALGTSTVDAGNPGPASGSIGLTGTMPGPAPSIAATITSPTSGQVFTSTPIQVSGSCPVGTIVEIYKSDIFAGSVSCSASGTYTINVDLLIGTNNLIATDYNALQEAGPSSNQVTVIYNVAGLSGQPLSSVNLYGSELLLNTDAVFRGTFPGQQLNVPLSIVGGVPPYAINTEWGDTTNSLISRSDNTTFNINHTYAKPGVYQISIQGSDSAGHDAFLTVAAIVNGQPAVAAAVTPSNTSKNEALVLWPLYAMAVTTVVSFWLGERREKHVLSNPKLTFHA
jgi:hypothetical protein